MKYNYLNLRRPVYACLTVFWLAMILTDTVVAQPLADGSSRKPVNKPVATLNNGISVTPAALHDTLNLDRTATHSVSLTNTTGSALPFTAVCILKTFPASADVTRVLVVTPEPFSKDLLAILNAYDDVQADLYSPFELPALTLSDMTPYDVVLVYNVGQFSSAGISADHLGDLLADYVDAGGRTILHASVFADTGWGIGGRFKADHYGPLLPADSSTQDGASLGTILLPEHPLMQSVDSLGTWHITHTGLALEPSAYAVALWGNGEIMAAANAHSVAFNFIPVLGLDVPIPPTTTGDLRELLHNAARYLRASSFLTVAPATGTLPAGGTAALTATFNSTGLATGVYTADVVLANTVTGQQGTIPASLTVTGPQFYTTPDSLTVALRKMETITKTLVLHNNGTTATAFKVVNLPSYIKVAPAKGNLPVGGTVSLQVTFSSGKLAFDTYKAGITFKLGSRTLLTPVSMRVYGAPDIAVKPFRLHETLPYKGESFTSFKVYNTGGNPLNYSMRVIGADADVESAKKTPVHKVRVPRERWEREQREAGNTGRNANTQQQPLQVFSGIPLLHEGFDSGTFPPGWQSVDNSGSGATWRFAADYGYGNFTGIGEAATVISELYPDADFDASLITPVIHAAPYKNIVLQYNVNFQKSIGFELLDLDIQVNDGEWVNIISSSGSYGAFYSLPGEYLTVPLGEYLNANASTFRLRWHYYDPYDLNFGYYVQIDDVLILGEARAWLTLDRSSGTIPVKGHEEVGAHFDAFDHKPGLYVGGIAFCSNSPKHPITALLATLRILPPEPLSANARVSVYPVPVQHEMRIAVPEAKEGSMVVTLLDAKGYRLFRQQGTAAEINSQRINTSGLQMNQGIYYVHVQYADGQHDTYRFVKE